MGHCKSQVPLPRIPEHNDLDAGIFKPNSSALTTWTPHLHSSILHKNHTMSYTLPRQLVAVVVGVVSVAGIVLVVAVHRHWYQFP